MIVCEVPGKERDTSTSRVEQLIMEMLYQRLEMSLKQVYKFLPRMTCAVLATQQL